MDTRLHGRIPRRYAIALKREQLRHLSILPTPAAAAQLGVTKRTVRSWRRRLHNPDYLEVKSPRGRKWLLPVEARQFLTDIIKQPATLYGFDDPYWTARKVVIMIDRQFSIQLSRVTAWNYLRRSNLTPQKPGTLYREQDPDKRRHWLEVEYPAILAQAKRTDAVIFFQDECSVALQPSTQRTWGTRGQTPVLRITGKRGGINCLSSVSIEGHLHWWTHRGKVETDTIYNYLADLRSHFPDREVIVIMDNSPLHKAQWLQMNAMAVPGLHLRYLPPYSPELNPDEKVWRHLKRRKLKHHGARSVAELKDLLDTKLAEIATEREFLLKITREFSHAP
jgi:transposase